MGKDKTVSKRRIVIKKPITEKPITEKPKTPAPAAQADLQVGGYILENGVPIPAATRMHAGTTYPFAAMRPGQSFVVPTEVEAGMYVNDAERGRALAEERRKIANRLRGAIHTFMKKNLEHKFAVRMVEAGVRVWRTE